MAGQDGESMHPRMLEFGGRGSRPAVIAAMVIALGAMTLIPFSGVASGANASQMPRLAPPSGDGGLLDGLSPTAHSSPTGRWIVAGRPGRATSRLARRFDASPISRSIGIYALSEEDATGFIFSLSRIGAYRFSEPDVRATPASIRNENASNGNPIDQWWLGQISRPSKQPSVNMKSPTLALLEDSLDPGHPDLDGLVTRGRLLGAFSRGDEGDARGTAMAALAMSLTGRGDRGKLAGVWPGMRVRLVKPDADTCEGKSRAVYRAAKQKENRVLLMAYGFTGGEKCFTHYAATEYAVYRGLIPIAEAPVAGAGPTRPASDPHVLTVTATNRDGDVPTWAGSGPSVDLAAPGDDIDVAWVSRPQEGLLKHWWPQSGTGYSATIVAAAAAWVMNERRLTARQVSRLLTNTADRIPRSGPGQINLEAALKGPTPVNDPFEPNDDIDWVRARSSLLVDHRGKKIRRKPFWRSGQRERRTVATLGHTKDPADVYRLWLGSRNKVKINVTSNDDVYLKVLGSGASSIVNPATDKVVLEQVVKAGKTYRVTLRNRGRRALTAFLSLEAVESAKRSFSYRISVKPRR